MEFKNKKVCRNDKPFLAQNLRSRKEIPRRNPLCAFASSEQKKRRRGKRERERSDISLAMSLYKWAKIIDPICIFFSWHFEAG